MQKSIGEKYDIIADGRDMATVVFPQAEHKFFLDASKELRTKRWQKLQKKLGSDYSFEESLSIVTDRDKRDIERKISPLKKDPDAMLIDNSALTIEQTVALIKSSITL